MKYKFKSAKQRKAVMAKLKGRKTGITTKPSGYQTFYDDVNYNTKKDRQIKALRPGKRVSKNGNLYYETRRNRSDRKGKRV